MGLCVVCVRHTLCQIFSFLRGNNTVTMNKKLFQLCLCVCAAIGINACDTGEHNDLQCDDTYVSQCLAADVYMTCSHGKLSLVYCDSDSGYVCRPNENGASCVLAGSDQQECANSCASSKTLNECQADGSTKPVDCATKGDGFVCRENKCQAPACEATCDEDGITLHGCKDDGTPEDMVCTSVDDNYICKNNACVEPCEETVCDADNMTLKECNDGIVTKITCSDINENYVCSNNACKEACNATCDTDGVTLHGCKEDGTPEDVLCTSLGDNFICQDNACIETCEETVCAEDGLTLKQCEEGFVKEVDCRTSSQICNIDECVTPTSVVGMPCTCEGNDCNYVITGAELKSLITEEGMEVFDTYLDSIDDDETIIGPNFYSAGNKGCEELQAVLPQGMTAACFRTAKVETPQAIIDLITTDLIHIFEDYLKDETTQSFVDFGNSIKDLVFSAKAGYCMPVVLESSLVLDGQAAKALDNEKFASDGVVFGKINTGDHATAQTNAECPVNSTFFSYDMTKMSESMGHFNANFDFCMQNCEEDSDCRQGYSCIELPEYGRTSAEPESKVCFDNSNIEYFLDLRAKLAALVGNLI